MNSVIQKVKFAKVTVNDSVISEINDGILILVGFSKHDDDSVIDEYIKKITSLRLLHDSEGKTNLSIVDAQIQVMVVPQFTLAANLNKGLRPSFDSALNPQSAQIFYKSLIEKLNQLLGHQIAEGSFGSHMEVNLCNDGPMTYCLDV
jgi:D-tyrosyl-tRNA(Tyr) deacylase